MLKKIILSSLLLITVICLGGLLSFNLSNTKVAYVQNELLFQEYKGKKELEMQLTKFKNDQKNLLDSLSLELLTYRKKVTDSKNEKDKKTLKSMEENFMRLSQEFERVNEQREEEYLNQIWKQLNQYVQDYGKEKGYDFIYGANGSGNIMYASEEKNVTKNVLEYINLEYEGK